jgi:uncharacterized protein YraI
MAVTQYPKQSSSSSWLEGKRRRVVDFVVIPLLIIAVLLLPPISLVQRAMDLGTAPVSQDGGTLSDPDGTQVMFLPGTVEQPFRADLASVPRVQFLEGSAGGDLLDAAKAIPPNLVAKSPFYELKLRGEPAAQSVWQVPIPNDSEPYETLDVYSWDGATKTWHWLPHTVIAEDDQIESRINAVAPSLMVVQTNPKPAVVTLDASLASQLPSDGTGAIAEVHPTGLYLGGDGAIDGSVDATFDQLGGSYAVIPVIRNYDGPIVRTDLLANMLVDEGQRNAHVDNLVNLAVSNLYTGVTIDYRGLDKNLRGEFNQFVKDLAEKLHAQGKTLAVRVEPASQIAEDRFDTGAYDWQTLGMLADTVGISAPIDPRAYVPGGQFDALLNYAAGQIDRYKTQVVFSGRSVEQSGNYLLEKNYTDALQPLIGRIAADQEVVEPGKPLNLALVSSRPTSGLVYDPNIGAYVYRYQDEQGNARTVWLENGASLSHKLDILKRYNLQGFTLENMPADGLDAELWTLMRSYQQGKVEPVKSDFTVEYTVKDSAGQEVSEVRPLSDSKLALAASLAPGALQVEAAIKQGNQIVGRPQAAAVAVATFTPEATATPEATPTPEYAELVANSNANVRSGPGTDYPRIGQLRAGAAYRVTGQNETSDWWQINLDGKPGWIAGELATVTGNTESVALVEVEPPPTAAPVAAAPAAAASSAAAAPAAAAPAPKPSGGGSFAYGMQVDPNGGHMNVIPSLGMNWVKFQVPWKEMEGTQGAKNFPDGWVNEAKANGLNVLASIVKAPMWARSSQRGEGPPADPAAYADYVGAFAAHYCGKVQAIEVWNEQNMDYEWGYENLDPVRYMQLLKAAYGAIKANCPSIKVISGAPTPAGMVLPNAYDDRAYLTAMYQNGLASYSDGIGAHPSGFGNPPNVTVQDFQAGRYNAPSHVNHASFYFLNTLQDYRNIMVRFGDGNKRIWPTEFGWGSTSAPHPGYEYEARISEDMQAQYIVGAYQKMKSMGYVGPAFLWCLDYNVTQPSTELAAFGILGRPAQGALAGMPK